MGFDIPGDSVRTDGLIVGSNERGWSTLICQAHSSDVARLAVAELCRVISFCLARNAAGCLPYSAAFLAERLLTITEAFVYSGFPRAPAPHSSHMQSRQWHFSWRVGFGTTFITISVNQGPSIYSLLNILDPLCFTNESSRGGRKLGRMLVDANNPGRRRSQQGKRERACHGASVHFPNSSGPMFPVHQALLLKF